MRIETLVKETLDLEGFRVGRVEGGTDEIVVRNLAWRAGRRSRGRYVYGKGTNPARPWLRIGLPSPGFRRTSPCPVASPLPTAPSLRHSP